MMTNGLLVGTNVSQVHTTSIFGVEYVRRPYKRRKPSYLTAKCQNPDTTQTKHKWWVQKYSDVLVRQKTAEVSTYKGHQGHPVQSKVKLDLFNLCSCSTEGADDPNS
jgi:hypothetical protein